MSKFTFNLKILSGVILLKVTLGVTWTQPRDIYIYIIPTHINQLLGWFASPYVSNRNIQNLNPHLFTWNVNNNNNNKNLYQ